MIITRTPLRISFTGGGSDFEYFYQKHGGAVVSSTIDKYVYITVNHRFDKKISLRYSKNELVENPNQLKHILARETLKDFKVTSGIEIISAADIPLRSTGLGSSSAYTVGLIQALSKYYQQSFSARTLAEKACEIEIVRAKCPIGKQDQYIVSFGGLSFIRFFKNGIVKVEKIKIKPEIYKKFTSHLFLLFTGNRKSSNDLLHKHQIGLRKNPTNVACLEKMVKIAYQSKNALENGNLVSFGKLLHENWLLKKQLVDGISSTKVNGWYETAIRNGALGGKICGAGGGGFLLLFVPPAKRKSVIRALPMLKLLEVNLVDKSSEILIND